MNRMMNAHINTAKKTERHSLGEWLWLLGACISYFFSLIEVRIVSKIVLGGGAFLMMLGVAGSIECGTVALFPGAVACLVLVLVAFLFLRGLGEEV